MINWQLASCNPYRRLFAAALVLIKSVASGPKVDWYCTPTASSGRTMCRYQQHNKPGIQLATAGVSLSALVGQDEGSSDKGSSDKGSSDRGSSDKGGLVD